MKREIWIMLILCTITPIFLIAACATNSHNGDDSISDQNNSASYIENITYKNDSGEGSLSINGTVYIDRNGNETLDQGKIGLAGWTVKLLMNGSEISRARTDRFGRYLFADLKPGTYTVAEELQTGWNQTHPDDIEYVLVLQDKNAHEIDFGNAIKKEFISNTTTLTYFKADELKEMKMRRESLPSAHLSPNVESRLKSTAQGQSFDLLDHLPIIASERDQGWCGNCWVWAGTGVMEVDNSVKNGIDQRLSIQYFSSNYNDGQGCDFDCCGGYLDYFADAYNYDLKKAIPWSNHNAQFADGNRCCSDSCSQCPPSGCDASIDHTAMPANMIVEEPNYAVKNISLTPIFTSGIPKEDAILAVKNVLMQNKAVMFSFVQSTSSDFPAFWLFGSESDIWRPDQTQCGSNPDLCDMWGHSVLCVGFDDTDPANRYWIMVNSWGINENRPNGIFLVSMDMDYNCKLQGEDIFYFDTFEIDWNNPPTSSDQIGVFRNGPWYLDYNGNRIWDPNSGDVSFWFGTSGDVPVTGDWNGDGWDEIGVFRNGPWYLDYNGNRVWDPNSGDVSFWFGTSGDIPLAGDWNGDGKDEIGVFRNGPWYLDYNGNRVWDPNSGDVSFWFGTSGDIPLAGDWNGDGKDEIGVFRNGPWYLDYNGNRVWDPKSGDVSFWFGTSGDLPLAGDWNSDGKDEIGVFRNGPWYLDYNGNRVWDPASGDVSFWFGTGGDKPLAGRWSLQPIPIS